VKEIIKIAIESLVIEALQELAHRRHKTIDEHIEQSFILVLGLYNVSVERRTKILMEIHEATSRKAK